MNENQTDRDEWLAAVEHNRKERIALLELASFMGWAEARTMTESEVAERENHNDR